MAYTVGQRLTFNYTGKIVDLKMIGIKKIYITCLGPSSSYPYKTGGVECKEMYVSELDTLHIYPAPVDGISYVKLNSDSNCLVSAGLSNNWNIVDHPYNGSIYIDIKELAPYKFLIKQNNQYYSVKDSTLTLLGAPTDDTQKEQWFYDYGVDDLKTALLTPDSSGNKLIDSLDSKFEIRMAKLKG